MSDNAVLLDLSALFDEDEYSSTNLLGDYHHIRHEHHLDQDHESFANTYQLLNNDMGASTACDLKRCRHVVRHFRERMLAPADSKGDVDVKNDDDGDGSGGAPNARNDPSGEFARDLISHIHV